MLAADLLNYDLPALKPTDTVGRALELLYDNRVEQLAVVADGAYQGIVEEDYLLNEPHDKPLADVIKNHVHLVVRSHQHLYEVLGLLIQHPTQVLAVLDEEGTFVGSLIAADIYRQFGQALGLYEPGAILEISLKNRDYSMAEMSRLVESEGAKITGSFISGSTIDFDNPLTLTLKLNRQNIDAVVATLERFGYLVAATHAHLPLNNSDQDRLDLLMKYLSM